jgi:transcriptional regulator with XRE-family HTH domain
MSVSHQEMIAHLSSNLRRLMVSAKLSQRELSRRAGVDPMCLNNAINGKSLISTMNLYRLSLALDRPMNWLVSDQEKSPSSRRKNKSPAA